ncbi:MAG: tetratricopeptide repeat protein [Bacteroidetes bacterium]|nr:tetratricopeptide repeat protein [Bacteroidota bacterium]
MKNFKYAISLEPDNPDHYNAMAGYYGLINMPDLEIETYNKGIELALNKGDKYTLYANLAQCYVNKYQPGTAITYLDKAIECLANDAFVYYKYGVILYDEGKYEEAKAKYQKALSLPSMENGLQSGLYYAYSKLCLKQFEYQKAKEYILKAIEMDPNNENYHDLYKRINNHSADLNW